MNTSVPDIDGWLQALTAEEGPTYRGFLGMQPDPAYQIEKALATHGIIYWEVSIFVKRDLQAARSHDEAEENILRKGLYVIADLDLQRVPKDRIGESFLQVATAGLFYFEADGMHHLTPERVRRLFDPSRFKIKMTTTMGLAFSASGWCRLKRRAAIDYRRWFREDVDSVGLARWRTRSYDPPIRGMLTTARKWHRRSFGVYVNRDPSRSVHRLSLQTYKSGSLSRYKDDKMQQLARESIEGRSAFMVEVWSPQGEVVGGVLFFLRDQMVMSDAIFYDRLDFAQVASIAGFELLAQRGINFVDIQMTTEFSGMFGGAYYDIQDFNRHIEQQPRLDLTTFPSGDRIAWTPPDQAGDLSYPVR